MIVIELLGLEVMWIGMATAKEPSRRSLHGSTNLKKNKVSHVIYSIIERLHVVPAS
jgi:hypothetical protein